MSSDESPELKESKLTLDERIEAVGQQQVEGESVSLFYRMGIVAVAILMVMLPLLYLGLVALVGWGLYLHATQSLALFEGSSGRSSMKGAMALYLTPIVVGLILLFFMLKPLFARAAKPPEQLLIKPDEHPRLTAFIENICKAVGAPLPKSVSVNCDVNASASFRKGFLSIFSQDLQLTIGLPLVAGMNARSLGGILAHEFGHFAQGTGMRVTYVIRRINGWFARVVYERDEWDEKLQEWSEDSDFRIMIVLYIARFFVFITRKILWALMMVGHVVSSFMLRQMEFDADRYEACFAGSDYFGKTSDRLMMLSYGNQFAMNALQESWKEKKLTNDYPELITTHTGRMPKETVEKIYEARKDSKTGLLDSHPCDADRLQAALKVGAPGIFTAEDPASELFEDFDEVSQEATKHHYTHYFGLALNKTDLVANDALDEESELRERSFNNFDRIFGALVALKRPLDVKAQSEEMEKSKACSPHDIKELSEAFVEVRKKQDELIKECNEEQDALIDLLKKRARLRSEFKAMSKEAEKEHVHIKPLTAKIEEKKALLAGKDDELKECIKSASQLMVACSQELLGGSELTAVEKEQVRRCMKVIEVIHELRSYIASLLDHFGVLDALIDKIQHDQNNERLVEVTTECSKYLTDVRMHITRSIKDVPYPFITSGEEIDVAEFVSVVPDPEQHPIIKEGFRTHEFIQLTSEVYFKSLALVLDRALNLKNRDTQDKPTEPQQDESTSSDAVSEKNSGSKDELPAKSYEELSDEEKYGPKF